MNAIAPGQSFGDYEIVDVAGTGGMGVVYRARQKSLDRAVALKIVRSQLANDDEYVARFEREARLAASIDHPNVVPVYDVGEIQGKLFLAMQWIDGEDLQKVISTGGALTPARAREITLQIAAALDSLHAAGLLHRDVKPANILIRRTTGRDHAYLTDFGIAHSSGGERMTQAGAAIGTPGFMAPEQLRGEHASATSDLYSLACVSFELFTGRPPFEADNPASLQWASSNEPRPIASAANPDLDDRYDEFFRHALAIDPRERFKSGAEFAESLERAQGRRPMVRPRVQDDGAAGDAPAYIPTAIDQRTSEVPASLDRPTPTTVAGAFSSEGPTDQRRRKGGSPAAMIAVAMIAVIGITVAVLAASGLLSGDDASADKKLVAAQQEAAVEKKKAAAEQKKATAAEEKLAAARAKARREKREAASVSNQSTQSNDASTVVSNSSSKSWPTGTSAWTVILVSASTSEEAMDVATRAEQAGLEEVGVLMSSDHSSLRPGYWVAYTGVLSESQAVDRQSEARRSGFGDAYARFVSGD